MEKLTDNTVMWFGKHKGTKLANIEAGWFLWYADYANNQNVELMAYINDNKMSLLQEAELDKLKR